MAASKKWNTGWTAALIGWFVSSLIFPFLPEIMKTLFDGKPLDLFKYPPMEYVATIGFWAALFLLVWIPAGFRAASLSRNNGTNRAVLSVVITFIVLLVVLGLVFRFLWNS